ncbi:MAG: AAA family ATPase [Flavobacterium sp.]|uniref:ATP-binding cassette domain-containing protein n=1 Tax=Flavobacterium sp. TaxID=239 RepID=UPI00262CADB4|nr:AAA family ATPase [Flavobacterium sp.]MDD5150686.1 AAA family ATPase [Flavobacterium sp.]
MITIEVTNDFRGIEKDTKFVFDKNTIIVGDNGCGKTALLSAIRGKLISSNKETDSLYFSDYKKLSENISIEHDYDKVFAYFSVEDDGGNMNNSFDAMAFIRNGGFAIQKISHGQKQFHYIVTLLEQIKQYKTDNPTHRILVLLDEFDKGFSLKMQIKACNLLLVFNSYGCDVICSTHNYFLIKKHKEIFDMCSKKYITPSEYIDICEKL